MEGVDLQKRYSKFSIGGEFILIRSNNDGVDSTGNSLAITQRAEYAAEFGAEVSFYFCFFLYCFFSHACSKHIIKSALSSSGLIECEYAFCSSY